MPFKRPLFLGTPTPGQDKSEFAQDALNKIAEWSNEEEEFSVTGNIDMAGFNLIFADGTGIVDENANEQLIFRTTASAVNYWEMTNSAANGVQRLAAKGDDTNIAITIASKGTDPINFEVNGATEASIDATGLLLASGNVINWNAGDVTITHAADKLTVAGGTLEVPDEAYDATSWNGSTAVPTKNAVRDKLESLTLFSPGMLMPYAGTSAPSLWLLCFGQAVSRTTYSALFAVTSTTYGVGDGSTTFNLPDLRGRVIAGQDDMGGSSANRLTGLTGGVDGDVLGGTGGEEAHTLTIAELEHNHTNAHTQVPGGGSNDASDQTSTINAVTATGHNNVPPVIILNYIIYAGV